jgi:protein-S-isoprenylcysteine O-methyltransferase Ste14
MSGTTVPATAPASRAEMINTWGRVVVSIVVLFLFAAVSTLVLTHTIPSSESATMVVGAVLTMAGSVVAYWIGSSAGSTAKEAKLNAATTPPPGGTTTTTIAAAPAATTTTTTAAPVEQPGTVTP